MRILYSFPHRIGRERICTTAWNQAEYLARNGHDITVFTGSVFKRPPSVTKIHQTLALGRFKLPFRLFGTRILCKLHDLFVAAHLKRNPSRYDVVHIWPMGGLKTAKTAKLLGIPCVLERCNSNTDKGIMIVERECKRIGVALPPGTEHSRDEAGQSIENAEIAESTGLLCPSDFVVKSYTGEVPDKKLLRTIYGVDLTKYSPTKGTRRKKFTAIFVGYAAVRKGLHLALEAWTQSMASTHGEFLIVGSILPEYEEYLAGQLAHPSVKVLGHRSDVPTLLAESHVLIFPSLEEGFALVCTEAMACGAVPLVSDVCTDECKHGQNALIHKAGDVTALRKHLDEISENRALWSELSNSAISSSENLDWNAATKKLVCAYEQSIQLIQR